MRVVHLISKDTNRCIRCDEHLDDIVETRDGYYFSEQMYAGLLFGNINIHYFPYFNVEEVDELTDQIKQMLRK